MTGSKVDILAVFSPPCSVGLWEYLVVDRRDGVKIARVGREVWRWLIRLRGDAKFLGAVGLVCVIGGLFGREQPEVWNSGS